MADVNRQVTLAARPVGFPKDSDFKLIEGPVPEPGDGEVVIRAIYASVDPYMRGRMNDRKSYAPPVQIGEYPRQPANRLDSRTPLDTVDRSLASARWSQALKPP